MPKLPSRPDFIRRYGWIIGLLIAFAVGFMFRGACTPDVAPPDVSEEAAAEEDEPTIWTCSMHPQIRSPEPGRCPICNMELIPLVEDEGSDTEAPVFATTESALALMDIQTTPAERRYVNARVRLVGKVDYDETQLAYITAWTPGRIEQMYVDYTGIQVNEGEHLLELYSPELLTAQRELRSAAQALSRLSGTASQTARATLEASRARLQRWGLTEEQIAAAEAGETPGETVTIYAPIGGTVIERNGREGMYVETGTVVYAIADLSKVWVRLEAYESDLPWLRYGQTVEFTTEAYPGKVFEGKIAFIDPVVDPQTRTVDLRVNVPNPGGLLKPDMFVRATVRAPVAGEGKVLSPELAGKWIGPMHPEIVRDEPDDCPICGMPLVPAEELGYVLPDEDAEPPLVIPATAALVTGKRAVVYVQVPDADKPTFEGREVVLGPRAGDWYIVDTGLEEGEKVVTHGNFKIDSELQIHAKRSMMSERVEEQEEAQQWPAMSVPDEFLADLAPVYDAYFAMQEALASDDFATAETAADALAAALEAVDTDLLAGQAVHHWDVLQTRFEEALEQVQASDQIEELRIAFQPLSGAVTETIRTFGVVDSPQGVYEFHCPMALDDGANWLQRSLELRNPYYGASMLGCGSRVSTLVPVQGEEGGAEAGAVESAAATPEEFLLQLEPAYDAYFAMQQALAGDDFAAAEEAADALTAALEAVDAEMLTGHAVHQWDALQELLAEALELAQASGDIDELRIAFEPLSGAVTEAIDTFGVANASQAVNEFHCPMAFDDGANWLQRSSELANPYYGASMLDCGEMVRTVAPASGEEDA